MSQLFNAMFRRPFLQPQGCSNGRKSKRALLCIVLTLRGWREKGKGREGTRTSLLSTWPLILLVEGKKNSMV
jgi:hypothetical protein